MSDEKVQIKELAKKNVDYLTKTGSLREGFKGHIRLDIEVNNGGIGSVAYVTEVRHN